MSSTFVSRKNQIVDDKFAGPFHFMYYWPVSVNEGSVGHISMNVWQAEKKAFTYISHWPETTNSLKKGQKSQKSLEDDIEAEDNRQPQKLSISYGFLDPAKIVQWYKKNEKRSWNLLTWNCANVVRKALQKGLKDPQLWESITLDPRLNTKPLTPGAVFTWAGRKFLLEKRPFYFKSHLNNSENSSRAIEEATKPTTSPIEFRPYLTCTRMENPLRSLEERLRSTTSTIGLGPYRTTTVENPSRVLEEAAKPVTSAINLIRRMF